ncbi:hypothetical protein APSETT444_001304 [Aspergillus pseudonomiae]
MRATLPLLALFTALPAVLAAGRCREGLNYCGSTLISLGWTQSELLAIADGDTNVEKALFYCEMDGIVEYSGPYVSGSFFDAASYIPPDAIFALTAEYNADTFPQKVNLGQGTYRDENGQPWVLPSVQKAREILLSQGLYHEYLPILGLQTFRNEATKLALGSEIYDKKQSKLAICQSLSGTGALHLAGLLLRSVRKPLPKVYIPSPTWSNHGQVFSSLGFRCETFQYYDAEKRDIDIEAYYSALRAAEPNSVVIIHACAHNPTGCDPSKEQWKQIGSIMKERKLFPLFDAAYLGFNSGNVDDDAFAMRYFIDELEMEAGGCLSFAKNMGLYGERVGCLFFAAGTEKAATNTQSVLEMLQRSEVSNPPAYGAKIASTILSDDALKEMWFADLITMSGRIRSMRRALYDGLIKSGAPGTWEHLIRQSGMFGFLGLSPAVVQKLKGISSKKRITMTSSNLVPKPWVPRDQPPDITLININVIDVEAGRVIPNCSVHVHNGLIARIMPASSLSRSSEAPFTTGPRTKTKFINMRNQYLCPGLIDCHVHLTATPGSTSFRDIFAASSNTIAYRTTHVARSMLLRGFTTARDTGGADAALRDAIAEGLLPGPRLFIAGKALSQTGGHGDLRAPYQNDEHKCCGGHSPALARVCNGVPACLEAVRDELRQGANFIKIMCGGGVATPTDALDMLQFTAEEIRAITTTAAYSKTYVTAHAYTTQAIRHAVDNGVRGIEHGNFIDPETARYCKEKGVVVTPTLITYQGMTEPPFDHFLDEFSQAKNRDVLAGGLEALEILRDAGITMCYGSDLLAGLHTLQNREFSIRSAVLSPLEILQSATINAAKLVGMEGKLGCIKEGAIADFLILNANPLEDITVLDHVQKSLVAIAKDGRIVTSRVPELTVDPLYDPFRIPSA